MTKHKKWSKLDNAAKIFPPTSSRRDTKVFRFSCELTEKVNGACLQHTMEKTIEGFSLYRSILKKGLFWYYLEESDLKPAVMEETLPICSAIYDPDKPGPLFRVSYYDRRINLEIFHALADGTSALHFLRTLVYDYLVGQYGIQGRLEDYDGLRGQKKLDAFYKYYDNTETLAKAQRFRAYRIRGERLPGDSMGIIEGILSVKEVLTRAHECNATLSEFLITLLICSIYKEMAVRDQSHPVVIAVPVDLRRFFPAQTARNFFGIIHVTHNFRRDGQEFEQVLHQVKSCFASQLKKENLNGVINHYSAIENNPAIKAVPLPLKIPVLRIAGLRAEGEETAAFSNVGRADMPPQAAPYIRLFDLFLSTKRPQLCLCSFGDVLAVSVSSPFAETEIQKHFFRSLTATGVSVQIISNMEQILGGDTDASV